MDRARVPCAVTKRIIGCKTDALYNCYPIVDELDIREGMIQSENYLANTNNAYSTHK